MAACSDQQSSSVAAPRIHSQGNLAHRYILCMHTVYIYTQLAIKPLGLQVYQQSMLPLRQLHSMSQGPATQRLVIVASRRSEQFLFTMMSCDAIKNGHSSNVALHRRSLRHIVNQPFYVNPVCTHNMQIKSLYCLRTCVYTHLQSLPQITCMHIYIHTHM